MEEQPQPGSHAEALRELFVAAFMDDRITWETRHMFEIGSVHAERDVDSPVILLAVTHSTRKDQPYLLLTPERFDEFLRGYGSGWFDQPPQPD